MKLTKSRIFILAIIVILIILVIYINSLNVEKEIVKFGTIELPYVENISVNSSRILLWDGDYLYYYNLEGELYKTIDRSSESLTIFFTENRALLYDDDLNKVYEYNQKGDLTREIKVFDEVYNIREQEGNLIFHLKHEEGERLASIGSSNEIVSFFDTDNYILTYNIKNPASDYIVTELSTSAAGYSTIVYENKNSDIRKMDYPSEVVIYSDYKDNDVILFTEKNYYRISKDDVLKKEIPLISDVYTDENNIYLLHSGILSKLDYDLKEISKNVVAANVNNIKDLNGDIYLYGLSDVAGNIGMSTEYYTRLSTQSDEVVLSGDTIAALHRDGVDIYKIQNKSGDEEEVVVEENNNMSVDEQVMN